MKIILRNFFFVLKRFKTSSVLNIIGLSAAFAVFSVTLIQVYYDFSFDRSFKKSDNIYQFSQCYSDGERGITMPTTMAKEISEKFPEVRNYCLTDYSDEIVFDIPSGDGIKLKISENITRATAGLLDVFTPKILIGDARPAFTEKNKAMISETTAHKLFGIQNPIGRTIFYHFSQNPLTIVAVYKDFPKNCSLNNGVYVQLPDDRPENYNYKGYFEVLPNDLNKLLGELNSKKFFGEEKWKSFKDPKQARTVELTKMPKMHFYFLDKSGSGSLTTTLSLLAIGILTLLIAYINFLNFSIAMAPARVRGLNIQKILGAKPLILKLVVAVEASIFSFISFLIALFLISFLKDSTIKEFFSSDLSLLGNWQMLLAIGLSSLIFGLMFGLYPAHYITSFQPAVALSGSFSMSGKSMKLRNVLITVQFISAILLIIVSSFIRIQNNYMQNYSWGMQKENIIYVPYGHLKTSMKNFGDELKKDPRIIDYTASQFVPGQVGMSWGREFEGESVSALVWPVHCNFLQFFGVKIVEGRNFIESDSTSTKQGIIFNQKFLKAHELKNIVGKEFSGFTGNLQIVGIAKNINFSSLRDTIQPMAFAILKEVKMHWFFIKISGKDTPATIDYIKTKWKKYSDEDFDMKFLDSSLNELYKSETNLSKLISIFGLIIIVIAIMGVYGLVVFNARYKSKEIAIRKVNGASVKEIMLMLNRGVLIQLSIAFFVAVPLSYFIVQRWLQGYAYKTPIYWWIFLLAGLLVFVITVITVSWQSYKAATANPVDAIKNE